ncbi:4'-phosphopantetheinyl transferase family protein [Scleromatobacter humisilvae]|uniref:4'-phosphopantetheinyl transferase superfamily protein n=1 Tax=Scleromatobacter humisilvae TaxID=2897159 RepID=A0A9X1YEB2_9BURK|nr:4'-phosphopantetheinyl transferase family protein [Scleromatobacter humisilvae]MCK9684281.1 4'-phosphopantetheinyl transferase superfamily protein [Scleromatobacter humisilvae]
MPEAGSTVPAGPPAWVGDSERARWARLKPGAQAAFAASRRLLRELLEAATGVAALSWSVSAEAGCAPRASAPGVDDDAVRVSLAHRLGWVAAAVSASAVGVDIELGRAPRSAPDERAGLMLAPPELACWHALPAERREAALLTAWTAKEAWFKACPAGAAPWDFRHAVATTCAPAGANVRVWEADALHVAICSAGEDDLSQVACAGLDRAATSTFWRVARA